MKSILGLSLVTLILALSRKLLVGASSALALYLFGIEESMDVLLVVFAVCTVFSGFIIPLVCAILAKYFQVVEWSWVAVFVAPLVSMISGFLLSFLVVALSASISAELGLIEGKKKEEEFLWGE